MTEKDCIYVSSRGLLKSCDVICDNLNSSTGELPDLNKMFDYCTLYICNAAIPNLVQNMSKINHKFILVSGDADQENYKQIFNTSEDLLNFVSNDNLIHWFSQNCTVDHPKVTRMPIGLDYHSAGNGKNPLEQEELLINIKNNSEPFDKRINKCYINFKSPPDFYTYAYDRIEALEHIPNELYIKENENRDICWKNQTKYTYVVSPFGNGLDCHRTWEALILGCIPIIRSSGMNKLFDNLPVLIVNDWKELTQQKLDDTVTKFKNNSFNYDKLTLKYWTDKINSYKKNIEPFTNNIKDTEYILHIILIFTLFILFYYNNK
jgi:hypothetical protein